MKRGLDAFVWVLFVLVVYLLAAEALRPWLALPGLGNIGFTLVFVLFAVLHCARCEGWRRTGLFFATAAVVSYALEETGVRTGMIYGPYHYSDMLGPKLGHVPVLIPLAWFMMIYPSWVTARALLRGVDTRTAAGMAALALIAAMVMTAWDTVMDPGMAAAGNWVWEHRGGYFGVPLRNYFGWLLTTFLVYCGAGLIWRATESPVSKTRPGAPAYAAGVANGFGGLPVIVYTVHGMRYVTEGGIKALHVVALFAMVLPGLIALAQVYLGKKETRR
ncbi:MAG: carotenoid biosynthesis protein [Terracidiphilus sp.]|jgi:putative membrane protein